MHTSIVLVNIVPEPIDAEEQSDVLPGEAVRVHYDADGHDARCGARGRTDRRECYHDVKCDEGADGDWKLVQLQDEDRGCRLVEREAVRVDGGADRQLVPRDRLWQLEYLLAAFVRHRQAQRATSMSTPNHT